jgi:outer membrane protein assembly factor BamA
MLFIESAIKLFTGHEFNYYFYLGINTNLRAIIMKKLFITGLLALIVVPGGLAAQDQDESKKDTVKTGFNLSGVPAVAYDSDIGFLYGIILNLYHYGDGTRYPRYNHSVYMEWSNTTKGSMKSILRYDSDQLIRGIRTSAEISYKTEQALDFYGFNGYKALYNSNFEDDIHQDYLSRLFYKMDRKILLLRADFTGDLIGNKLKWFAGIEFQNMAMDTVNTTKLNEGKSDDKKLKYVEGGLFGNYANNWGIIPADQINGGSLTLLKAGLIYDTRDNEPNPMKGIWSEAQLLWSPAFLGNTSMSYTRLILTHRQYFTIIPEDLNFAYRLSYQAKLGGKMPYYMLPWVYNSPPNFTRDGLGGNKTLRGILRNRVVGEDYLYANIELRWKFLYFQLLNQNFYLALSGFLDAGMVTGEYEIDKSGITDPPDLIFFPDDPETIHTSAGGGLHIAWNRNFIVAVDYGRALNKRDGLSGLYIGLDFLF